MTRNAHLESEVAILTQTTTKNEQRLATKRDWAEKRLHEEESTIRELKAQLTKANSELSREKESHQATAEAYAKELADREREVEMMGFAIVSQCSSLLAADS